LFTHAQEKGILMSFCYSERVSFIKNRNRLPLLRSGGGGGGEEEEEEDGMSFKAETVIRIVLCSKET
jgi:hypothetical protein